MEYNKVLIVDDSLTSCMIIQRCFEITGFQDSEFICLNDGLQALDYLEKNKVDLIVTDINMPKLDGLGLISKLKEIENVKDSSLIIITSKALDVDKNIQFDNFLGIINKPVSPEKVMKVTGGNL